MRDRPSHRKCAIDGVGLAFVVLVAASSALLADDLTQPTASDPTVGPELESPAAVALDPASAAISAEAGFPYGTSPQSELIATPSDTTLDATVEVQIRSDFNDLRREFLEDRMKLVDWWLTGIAIWLTLIGAVAAIGGYFSFKRFREIEAEASENVVAASTHAENAKKLVEDIEAKRDEAKSRIRELTSEAVDMDPNKVDRVTHGANADLSPTLIDRAISAAIEMQRLRDFEGAVEKWQGVASVADGTDRELGARAWFSVGYLHAIQLRPREAIIAFDEAIRLKGDLAEAFNNRGTAKSHLGEHEAALSDYDEAIRLKPDYAGAFYNRGLVKSALGRHEAALSDYDEAIRLKPDYAGVFYNRGVVKSALGRHEAALSDYDAAIRLKPDYAEAFVNRGHVKGVLGRHEAALSDYDAAIRLRPDYAEAFYNRGSAKGDLGRRDDALSDYDEAIRLKPDYAEAFINRGAAKSGLGRHEAALADYDQAIRLKPDLAETYNNRGSAMSGLGRHEAALADYDEAIRLNPKHVTAFYNRGSAKSELGRHYDALSDYNQAIQLEPGFVLAYLQRARSCFHLGRSDGAWRDLETVRKLAAATGDQSIVERADELVKQFFGGETP